MSVEQIQREVSQLSTEERRQLTAWLCRNFPPVSVEELVEEARERERKGLWSATLPTADNIPSGEALENAISRAKVVGLVR